ncbi:CidA/LrgA family protein [Shouchella shacheensis]|uniref:CidA/LrgA family protein n=1 Tax=Shouchella shacheensis TaxID=1649580 RepID=UPI00073FF016|nr:CidA/LrgA family holin-like protein [Shouchella shacheensis]
MKAVQVLGQLAGLYLLYLLGEWLAAFLHLPVSGSIIGMLLLFVLLVSNIMPARLLERGANFLLAFLPLLFLPVTVGVMNYPELLSFEGAWLIVSAVVSTGIVMTVSGRMAEKMALQQERGEQRANENTHHSAS